MKRSLSPSELDITLETILLRPAVKGAAMTSDTSDQYDKKETKYRYKDCTPSGVVWELKRKGGIRVNGSNNKIWQETSSRVYICSVRQEDDSALSMCMLQPIRCVTTRQY